MQLDKFKRSYICTNDVCTAKEKACPLCYGKLTIKFNKKQNNRPFMGCSNYGAKGCEHTENV